MRFTVERTSTAGKARTGRLELPRGTVETPAFMPVGTNATVKSLRPEDLSGMGYGLILSNTYHLYLRPGDGIIRDAGGLHRFMNWPGNILTDSGGFQVFSLAEFRKVREDGVEFRSHIDGSRHFFSPEKVVDIQRNLGSEIMMPIDECTPGGTPHPRAAAAEERTFRWAAACREAFARLCDPSRQTLFGIVQGNIYPDLREKSARNITSLDFPGYAVGGFSVGEKKELMYPMLDHTTDFLPPDRPRYLMGVGEPVDLLEGVARGIDMFDCVLPTRNARNAALFTPAGQVSLRNNRFREAHGPLVPSCGCYTCTHYSAAYLRHLFKAGEILASVLATLHNLHFLWQLMADIRAAIREDRFAAFRESFRAGYLGSTAGG